MHRRTCTHAQDTFFHGHGHGHGQVNLSPKRIVISYKTQVDPYCSSHGCVTHIHNHLADTLTLIRRTCVCVCVHAEGLMRA